MLKNETKPTFTMTYGDLGQLGDSYLLLLARDLDKLSGFGLSAATVDELRQRTLAFQGTRTDDYYKGLVSEYTRDRDLCRDSLKTLMAELLLRVGLVFGEDSPEYQRYGMKGADRLSDNDYWRLANAAVGMAAEQLAQLEPRGLTQSGLDALRAEVDRFNGLIDLKNQAVRERDAATQHRLRTANQLFALISEISAIGKRYYISRDEARYNDYLIY